ncbi:MAG: recombinase family protein [Clostridia bacterium]|nr:recombinase family protein [Clostridia bacterium]
MASQRRTIQRNGTKIKRAVAYARFSSNNQRDESIDAQLRAIREYCERNDIQLVDIYTDEAQSATTDNRDDFKVMIDNILKGKLDIDAVLVHKFNRFARNKYDSALYKKRLRDIGINVISVTQPIDDSPEGRILESLIEAMDEYYSENLALEVKKGMLENALKGKHTGGGKLLGLSVDDEGYYYPDENAPIVQRIFKEYADGVPKAKIVERLNREGYKNQYGRPFNTRTLLDLLQNEKYIGNYVYNHTQTDIIRLEGVIKEPIIDEDLWDEVQKLRHTKNKPKHRKRKYLLTGKMRCGLCGFTYCGSGGKKTNKNGDVAAYYKCQGKVKNKNGCTNPSLNKDYYEKLITDTITETVLTDNAIEEIAGMVLKQLEDDRKSPQTPTAKLKKQLAKIIEKQTKLTDLYLDGEMDRKTYDKRNAVLKEQRKNTEHQIEKNEYLEQSNSLSVEEIKWFITDFKKSLSADEEYQQTIFNTFVDSIIVNEDNLDVTLKVDFSTIRGDKVNNGGATRIISPLVINKTIKRKTHQQGLKRK